MKIVKNVYAAMLALVLCSASLAVETERVVLVRSMGDVQTVQKMLDEGWTVKYQSVAASGTGAFFGGDHDQIIVFTLQPPTPERVAEMQARKKAEWDRRRAEYLAKKAAAKNSQ